MEQIFWYMIHCGMHGTKRQHFVCAAAAILLFFRVPDATK